MNINQIKMIDESLVFVAISLFAYVFYKWATSKNNYFQKRNLKFMKPTFLVGNTGGMFSRKFTATEFSEYIYKAFPNES